MGRNDTTDATVNNEYWKKDVSAFLESSTEYLYH
jgi:hypothetical protein